MRGFRASHFSSYLYLHLCLEDSMFIPHETSEDEEETIEKEEERELESGTTLNYNDEIAELERDSQLPIEEVLAGLPKEMLEEIPGVEQPTDKDNMDQVVEEDSDDEFKMEGAYLYSCLFTEWAHAKCIHTYIL